MILCTVKADGVHAECQTYFFVSGSEVYYTDDGVLKMYNIENQTHKSWNIRPDIRKDLLLSTIFFIWAVQDRYNMYFFRMWKSAELLK